MRAFKCISLNAKTSVGHLYTLMKWLGTPAFWNRPTKPKMESFRLSFLLDLHLDFLVYPYALQELFASLAQTSSSSVSFCASATFISSSFLRVSVSTFSEALLLSSEETSPSFSNASRS